MIKVQGDEMVERHYVTTNGNSQQIGFSNNTQEVPKSIAGMDPEEFNKGVGVLNSGETNPENPMEPEEYKRGEILYSDIDAAMSENENVSGSGPTPRSENAPNKTVSYSPNSERQRPTRATRRPTRFRDSDFETQFQPKERKRKCNRLRGKDQTGNNIDNFHTRAENNPCFRFG